MTDLTWLESAPLSELMARPRKARRGVRADDFVFAEGVHSANEAVS